MLGVFIMTATRGNVRFTADDRFDAEFDRGLIKFDRTKEISVVGHAERGHFIFGRFLNQLFDTTGTIEEAVLRVDVEMDKIRMIHFYLD